MTAQTAERERRLDEAIAEYLEAVDAGGRPEPAVWLDRFPDLASDLVQFFAGQQQVGGLLDSLGATPANPATLDHSPGNDTVASDIPPISRPFGDFELIAEIARGGMGVVFRARQARLNRVVALKMILAGRLASAADVQRFRSEAEAAAHLDHPSIVPIYEVGEHEGQHYFSMKLIEGGNLAQHTRRFRADPRGTARLLAAVARAVHHAHQRGVLHRDLKPANILLDADGQPHLTDFGLARRLGGDAGLTRSGIAVGTPSYMAPEQAAGPHAAVTTAADVYSLGAILYELLTGRPPFVSEHPLETLRQVLEREPARPRALEPRADRDLETVCLKCLDKDPARRYASAAELADDLERFLNGESVRARPVGRVKRMRRWCRRRPVTAALSASLAVSLVAGTALIAWQWWRAEEHLEQLQTQYDRAETERERAERESTRAEEGFRQAHQAVKDFCTRVSEGRMRDAAGLQPERRELLQSSLRYFQEFLRQRGDDPTLRRELADTHFRIGTISALLGPKGKALEAYGRACAVYEKLLGERPGDISIRTALAETHARIGIVQDITGNRDEAMKAYREAARRYEELLGERPKEPGLHNGTAAVCNNLAMLHRSAGEMPEAVRNLTRARELQEALVEREPKSAHFRANLAMTYGNLGDVESSLSHGAEAIKVFRKALALQEQLVADDAVSFHHQQQLAKTCRQLGGLLVGSQEDAGRKMLERSQSILERLVLAEPAVPAFQRDLAAGCRQLGHFHRDRNRLKEALAEYDRGLALMKALAREHSELPEFRNDLAKCHFDRAAVLSRKGQPKEALASYQAAAELRRTLVEANPENVGYHVDLGLTLGNLAAVQANLNRRDDAVAAARESVNQHQLAVKVASEVASYRRYLRGAWGRLARIAADAGKADEALGAARARHKLAVGEAAELYASAADFARLAKTTGSAAAPLAVAALREAAAAGFNDANRLANDPAFAAVRDRADFRDLLSDLKRATRR